jgi:UDP-GlcNAc:undecaprenyl-phosphate GlcNAc-1-phosphate transferase
MPREIAGALAASIVVIALLPPVARLALRVGAVVHPRSDRWSRRPVPVLGGIAIACGITVGLIVGLPMGTDLLLMLLGVGVMLGLGLCDDLRGVSPRARLAIQAMVAAAFVFTVSAGMAPEVRVGALALGIVAIPLAVNATNMVDNADGLAAGLSTVTGSTLALAAIVSGLDDPARSLGLIVSAACLAFLTWNRPRARMFMGDSGSLMLGFALAGTSVLLLRDAVALSGALTVVIMVAVVAAWAMQLGDVAMVVVTRTRRGVSPFAGGVDHSSHRLMAAGLDPLQMLGTLVGMAALCGSIGLAAVAINELATAVLALLLVCLLVVGFHAYVGARLAPGRIGRPDPDEAPLRVAGAGLSTPELTTPPFPPERWP